MGRINQQRGELIRKKNRLGVPAEALHVGDQFDLNRSVCFHGDDLRKQGNRKGQSETRRPRELCRWKRYVTILKMVFLFHFSRL